MIDAIDTERLTNGLLAAASGYMSAATAAYSELMIRGLDLWGAALAGLVDASPDDTAPARKPSEACAPEPAFGLARDDWNGLPWLDAQRMDTWFKLGCSTDPVDMLACAGLFSPLRGSYASWPFAKSMIDAGVPRSVAWPTAEAHAAVFDAAATAVAPVRKLFAGLHVSRGPTLSSLPLAFMMPWGLSGGLSGALPGVR